MRAVSALAACGLCVYAGWRTRRRLVRRAQMFAQLCTLPTELRTRCVQGRESVPAVVRDLTRQEAYNTLSFLTECADRCAAGADFPYAWETAARSFLRALPPEREIAAVLPQMGALLAGGNAAQIDAALDAFAQTCACALVRARDRAAAGGRLCVQLGVGAGVLLGILIL